VEKYCRAGQETGENMVHAYCMTDTCWYKYALRICNTYCFCSATVVARRRLNVNAIRILPVLLCYGFDPLIYYNFESVLELRHSPTDTSLGFSAQNNTKEYRDMLGNARIT
jgi:hypothetical protein